MASRRALGVLSILSALVAVLLVVAVIAPAAPNGRAVAATPTTTTIVAAPGATFADNPFLPEERNISDCISALPRPGCGSEARGGWRQTLVFGFLALGLLFIAWRIVMGLRRQNPVA